MSWMLSRLFSIGLLRAILLNAPPDMDIERLSDREATDVRPIEVSILGIIAETIR